VSQRVWMGQVASGKREAARFIALAPVFHRLKAWLGSPPYPGTLNLVFPRAPDVAQWLYQLSWERWDDLGEGICAADVFSVQVGGERAVIIRPLLADYPPDLLELAASRHLRSLLGVSDGDWVAVAPGPQFVAQRGHSKDEIRPNI
jgi:CTP-dependent riboflavin kinase